MITVRWAQAHGSRSTAPCSRRRPTWSARCLGLSLATAPARQRLAADPAHAAAVPEHRSRERERPARAIRIRDVARRVVGQRARERGRGRPPQSGLGLRRVAPRDGDSSPSSPRNPTARHPLRFVNRRGAPRRYSSDAVKGQAFACRTEGYAGAAGSTQEGRQMRRVRGFIAVALCAALALTATAHDHRRPRRRERPPLPPAPRPSRRELDQLARADRALSGRAARAGADGVDVSARGRRGRALGEGQSRASRTRRSRTRCSSRRGTRASSRSRCSRRC